MINRVVLWSNGMVMVFDAAGHQLADYQGQFLEVRDRILRDAPPEALFEIGHFRAGVVPTSRASFACEWWLPK